MLNDEISHENIVKTGSKAPDFSLKTDKNTDWTLSNQLGKVTVLLFYPQNECIICTKQLCSVRDNWEKYLNTGAVIVGISPGQPEDHQSFVAKYNLPLTLLVDEDRKIAKNYVRHWFFPAFFTRGIVVINAQGTVCTRKVMARPLRPTNNEILTDIYAARGEAVFENYQKIKTVI